MMNARIRRPFRFPPTWSRTLLTAFCAIVLLAAGITPAQPDTTDSSTSTANSPDTVPAGRQASNVYVITVRGPIDDVTYRSIKRRMAIAQQQQADAIVFEIDTWGGQGTSALSICTLIKQCPIPNTVAWVHPKAISAGTFIALACKEIVIVPGGYMGDCAPILPGLIPIPAAERAKMESPYLSEMVNSARKNGYDERLAMAFVAVDIELWLVENNQTGDRLFISRDEYGMLFDNAPPESTRRSASGGLPPSDMSTITAPLPFLDKIYQPDESRMATMTRQERDAMIELNQELRSARPVLSESDRGTYTLIETVIDKDTLLIAHTDEARRWGLSQDTIANDAQLKDYFGAATMTRLNSTWSENLVQKLTSMPVRIILLVVFLIGLIWEMATPGVGVPISISIVAGLILFGAPALTGMAQWWDLLLIVAGVIMIAIEVFVIPGFGVAGVLGIACLGVGFIGTFVAPDPTGAVLPVSELARQAFFRGLMTMMIGLFGGGVVMWFGVKHYQNIPGLNRLVLSNRLPAGGRGQSLIRSMDMMRPGDRPAIGQIGVVISTLRPVGRARFGQHVLEVASGRGIVEEGTRVKVTGWKGFETIVEAVDDSA